MKKFEDDATKLARQAMADLNSALGCALAVQRDLNTAIDAGAIVHDESNAAQRRVAELEAALEQHEREPGTYWIKDYNSPILVDGLFPAPPPDSDGDDPDAWRTEDRVCEECGGEFVPSTRTQVYCCPFCENAGRLKTALARLTVIQAENERLKTRLEELEAEQKGWRQAYCAVDVGREEKVEALESELVEVKAENEELKERLEKLEAQLAPDAPLPDIDKNDCLRTTYGRMPFGNIFHAVEWAGSPPRVGLLGRNGIASAFIYCADMDEVKACASAINAEIKRRKARTKP